jgi:REP element-mobilizing transposase RayT
MTPDLHHHLRRSIRLRGYDYAQAGAYFVTICAHNHARLFGAVVDGEMHVNDVGRIVKDEWLRTGTLRSYVRVLPQEFVVMPNHVHGIVWLLDRDVPAETTIPKPGGSRRQSLGAILAGFKAASTKRVNIRRAMPGAPVWQRSYYEHIIRNDESLDDIRRYIAENPARWAFDRENPSRVWRGDRW